jgi:hypothetical protein
MRGLFRPNRVFAAAPWSASEAHRRVTSHGMPRFSGRRVYRFSIT